MNIQRLAIHSESEADLELVLFDDPLGDVLLHLMEDSQHGNVGFPGSRRGTDQQVLVCLVGRIIHHRLDTIQGFGILKGKLCNLQQKPNVIRGILVICKTI